MPGSRYVERRSFMVVRMDTALDIPEDGTGTALDERLARLGPNQRALLEERLHQGPVYDTFAACAEAGLRVIGTRHQQPAAMMAAAQNYFAGRRKAATIVSSGVPAANALGAIVATGDNCWPLVVLWPVPPRSRPPVRAISWRTTLLNSTGRSRSGQRACRIHSRFPCPSPRRSKQR